MVPFFQEPPNPCPDATHPLAEEASDVEEEVEEEEGWSMTPSVLLITSQSEPLTKCTTPCTSCRSPGFGSSMVPKPGSTYGRPRIRKDSTRPWTRPGRESLGVMPLRPVRTWGDMFEPKAK